MENLSREVVSHFYKDSSKRVRLYSLTVLSETDVAGTRNEYDVDYSRKFGYIFHLSGGGGHEAVEVSGIYHVTATSVAKRLLGEELKYLTAPKIIEKETQYICPKANERNRTRQLFKLPEAFDIEPGQDLLDWLQDNGIEGESVWCSTCRDFFPGENSYDLCKHVWWCDKTCDYSTPDDRCNCKDHEECREQL